MIKNSLLEFEKWLIQEDYSSLTIKSYLPRVSYFLKYFENSGKNVNELWKSDIRDYLNHLHKKKYKARTINVYLEAARTYIKFLYYDTGELTNLTKLSASGVPLVKFPEVKIVQKFNHTKEMSMFDFNKIIDVATDWEDWGFILLMNILLTTGLRINEALSIKADEILNTEIEVKGKRQKYRTIYPVAKVRKLARYHLRTSKRKSEWLFTGYKGQRLSVRAAQHNIVKYGKLAKVKSEKLFLHNIRHLFAIEQIKMGRPLNELAREMGIKDFKVLEIYQARANKKVFNEKISRKIW